MKLRACSPSLGDVGASDVVVLDAKENALGFDCKEFGSSNLSMPFNKMGVAVKLRTVSGGVIVSIHSKAKTKVRNSNTKSKRVTRLKLCGVRKLVTKGAAEHVYICQDIAYHEPRATLASHSTAWNVILDPGKSFY